MFEWYQENYLKANANKSNLFLSPFSNKEMTIANYYMQVAIPKNY